MAAETKDGLTEITGTPATSQRRVGRVTLAYNATSRLSHTLHTCTHLYTPVHRDYLAIFTIKLFSQCSHGAVSGIYETGKALIDAGVIPGSDITPEAALTKLSYVLAKDNWDLSMKRRAMEFCVRGEMTAQLEAVHPATQVSCQ